MEHKAMQPSDPSTLRQEGTIMLREWVQTVPGMRNKEKDRSPPPALACLEIVRWADVRCKISTAPPPPPPNS